MRGTRRLGVATIACTLLISLTPAHAAPPLSQTWQVGSSPCSITQSWRQSQGRSIAADATLKCYPAAIDSEGFALTLTLVDKTEGFTLARTGDSGVLPRRDYNTDTYINSTTIGATYPNVKRHVYLFEVKLVLSGPDVDPVVDPHCVPTLDGPASCTYDQVIVGNRLLPVASGPTLPTPRQFTGSAYVFPYPNCSWSAAVRKASRLQLALSASSSCPLSSQLTVYADPYETIKLGTFAFACHWDSSYPPHTFCTSKGALPFRGGRIPAVGMTTVFVALYTSINAADAQPGCFIPAPDYGHEVFNQSILCETHAAVLVAD